MSYSRLCRSIVLIGFCVGVSHTFGQQNSKPLHSWDVFMNTPEGREAANKLLGHCGDASAQDVMNACFAIEFKNAEQQMNSTYQATLKRLGVDDRQGVRVAQRAWLQYRERHCQAVGLLHAGGGSLEPTEVFSCKAELTKARTKEIQGGYQVPE
jgi:uncharacterized protein YecT (DUF1311 family)